MKLPLVMCVNLGCRSSFLSHSIFSTEIVMQPVLASSISFSYHSYVCHPFEKFKIVVVD